MHDGAMILYAAPAPVFPVSNGNEGLQVCSLQAILQQLLCSIDVLRDALHALVQHPRALADLALGGGFRKNDRELGGRGVTMCNKLAKMMHEIESGDCAASLLTHTHTPTSTGIERGEQRDRCSSVSLPLLLPSGPASISHLLPDNPVLRRC